MRSFFFGLPERNWLRNYEYISDVRTAAGINKAADINRVSISQWARGPVHMQLEYQKVNVYEKTSQVRFTSLKKVIEHFEKIED